MGGGEEFRESAICLVMQHITNKFSTIGMIIWVKYHNCFDGTNVLTTRVCRKNMGGGCVACRNKKRQKYSKPKSWAT